jgi:hypothetical protein
MGSLIKRFVFAAVVAAFVLVGSAASPAVAGPLSMGDVPFSNPDELSDCPLAPPAFSGNVHVEVYDTDDPTNPAAPYLSPSNPDSFTLVFTVTNDLLLDLMAECTGGPSSGDPNTAYLYKLTVGTFNLGYGDFTFPMPAQYGTIDDSNSSTPAPSSVTASLTAVEFVFGSPNINPGQITQKLFFTIPSIEPDEVAYFTIESTGGSTDDEPFVPLPTVPVSVERMGWGALKARFR